MIAWKPKPFIFIHIPKCAGTSIEAALIPLATSRERVENLTEAEREKFWLPGKSEKQHRKLSAFAPKYELRAFFKFSVVRNPWDRAISQIEFLRKGRQSGKIFTGGTLKENIKIYCQTTQRPGSQDLGACQLDYLLNKSAKPEMDFIGRFESLAKDFKHICAELGISPAVNLPHFKKVQRPFHYSAYYDQESIEWVRKRFARDIDFFGYDFEVPSNRPVRGVGSKP